MKLIPKSGLYDLCGRKFVGKSCTKNFSGNFEEIRSNPSHPKICLLLHLWLKRTSAPVAPLSKGKRRKCPRHAYILRHPCAYYSTHTLL